MDETVRGITNRDRALKRLSRTPPPATGDEVERGAHAISLVCSVGDKIGDIPTQRKYAKAVIAALLERLTRQ